MSAEQLTLLPDEPLRLITGQLDIFWLSHEEVPEATKQLTDSIRRFGVLNRILVRRTFDGGGERYDIVDGRRRLSVCRKLGHLSIPVEVAETDLAIADVATLAMNATRTNNVIAEFEAIQRLTKRGASIKEIASATGMPQQTIKKRQQMLNLDATLADGFTSGKIAASVAQDAAKLPAVIQKRLAETFFTEGTITAADVHEARTARKEAMAHALTFDFISDEPEAVAEDEGDDLYLLAQQLQEIATKVPQESERVAKAIRWAAGQLIDLYAGYGTTPVVPGENDDWMEESWMIDG